MTIRPLFAALAVVALAGCAADPAPNEQMRLTEQALEYAEAMGYTVIPSCSYVERYLERRQRQQPRH